MTTFYCTDVKCSMLQPWLEDYLMPEWANLRFLDATSVQTVIGAGEVSTSPDFAVTGPTSRAMRFRIGSGRSWGIGLMPAGWALLTGVSAAEYADRSVDGRADPAFALFTPLADALAASNEDYAGELAMIQSHMARLCAAAPSIDPAIAALNAALVDPDTVTVADLAARLGVAVRSVERLSRRAFGFAPKLLLRRQRFLRSLERFMLDPDLTWLGALDCHYHDQSHFVRDFQRFMGMCPSDYARKDKPLLAAATQARMAAAGHAMQGLHDPEGSIGVSTGARETA
ncbi:50S ribosomal protein L20 [Porphyrobacter sp. AAP60]|nr:50S ribosomal protein L20 [Porphyrobacter sp. AAP60]